jgi:hypothetical protein
MSLKFLAAAVAASAMLACSPAMASSVMFIPNGNSLGQVFTTDTNDGYASGRGVMFRATANFVLTDVAIYQNLQGKQLNFKLKNLSGGTTLWEGSQTVTTNGLEFIHFVLPTAITLEEGQSYFLDFGFEGASLENFFYNEGQVPSYSVPGFDWINGTLGGDPVNTVIPRIELNSDLNDGGVVITAVLPGAVVPEPATWALMITGFGAAGAMLRRRRRETLAAA